MWGGAPGGQLQTSVSYESLENKNICFTSLSLAYSSSVLFLPTPTHAHKHNIDNGRGDEEVNILEALVCSRFLVIT